MSTGHIFLTEMLGTAILLLLGGGVVANVILPKSKGFGGGWLLITFGWGLAVFAGVFVAAKTGAHINPAVTVGFWVQHMQDSAVTFGPDIPVALDTMFVYFGGQLVGAMIGAVLVYLTYKQHFDQDADAGVKLAVFSTGPELRSYGWNFVTEAIGTFVLVFVIMSFSNAGTTGLGPLAVALLVVGIGASLGGPTGYAINPARDLGPRIVHALLPIPGKGASDWSYSWVPVLGPIVGGALAGVLAPLVAF
jgi:glycerol uptake facilitator protein